jgi:hypothetical protein
LKREADGADGSTLLHVSPADSTHMVAEDPKYVQNVLSKLEPEPTDGFLPLHSNPAVSSSGAESEPKNLWDGAYNTLREKNPELIDAYEKDLLASQNSNQQGMSVHIRFLLAGRH